jgi:predicted RNA-binding Zn-ribbon protein involved in translation (DUF1610 family)
MSSACQQSAVLQAHLSHSVSDLRHLQPAHCSSANMTTNQEIEYPCKLTLSLGRVAMMISRSAAARLNSSAYKCQDQARRQSVR